MCTKAQMGTGAERGAGAGAIVPGMPPLPGGPVDDVMEGAEEASPARAHPARHRKRKFDVVGEWVGDEEVGDEDTEWLSLIHI